MIKELATALLVTVLAVGPALARSAGKAAHAAPPARVANSATAPRAAGTSRKPALNSRVSTGGLKPKHPTGLPTTPGTPAPSAGSNPLGKAKRRPY
jgi:hypothetical protein